MINWDDDKFGDEIIFSSHTSITTENLIHLNLKKKFSSYESPISKDNEIK